MNSTCDCCQSEKVHLRREVVAKANGLVIIGASAKKHAVTYRFEKCGHIQEIVCGLVKSGGFSCQKCTKLKLDKEAELRNLRLVGSAFKGSAYRLYEFKECGHLQELSTSCIRANTFRCQTCLEYKHDAEATLAGMEIVGAATLEVLSLKSYRKYKFKSCGHIQDAPVSSVREGVSECKVCKILELEKEAELFNLYYLGKCTKDHGKYNKDYRSYKCKLCETVQDIKSTQLRRNETLCAGCGNSHWDKPSKHYVIKMTDNNTQFTWVKVGVSKNTAHRIKDYRLARKVSFEVLLESEFMINRKTIETEFERPIQRMLQPLKLDKDFMKQYMQRGGFDECYTIESLPAIYEFYENYCYK